MAHPYRTRHEEPLPAPPQERRLGAATFVFGMVCAILGSALSGPSGALFATLMGVVLLLAPPPHGQGPAAHKKQRGTRGER